MDNNKIQNPNDFKVVEFHNSTNFDFTPELGAMYDSRPFFVGSGEKKQYPYHVGHLLARNLAKAVLMKGAPEHNPNAINPVGTPLWGDDALANLKNSFLRELYVEENPVTMSETDKLMAKVAELERLFKEKSPKEETTSPTSFQDKAEVIAELEKRGITHDKRSTKATLETLLV